MKLILRGHRCPEASSDDGAWAVSKYETEQGVSYTRGEAENKLLTDCHGRHSRTADHQLIHSACFWLLPSISGFEPQDAVLS